MTHWGFLVYTDFMITLARQVKLKIKKFDELMIKLKTKYLDESTIYSDINKLDEKVQEIAKLVDNNIKE
mgnify:CR=1 FL=1